MIEHTPRLRELTPPQPCSLFRVGRCHIISRIYTRRAHHVENARSEAEQQKHDHSPRGNSKPSIDEPADRCTDKNAGHQFRRQPKAPRHGRGIGTRPLSGAVFRPFARLRVSKLFAETFKSRRERSVTIRWLPAAIPFARVAGHAYDTRESAGNFPMPLKIAGPYWIGFRRVKNRHIAVSRWN